MNLKNFAAMHDVSEVEAIELQNDYEEWATIQDEIEYNALQQQGEME